MADFFSGNTGVVTFTGLGDHAAQAIAFNFVTEQPVIDVGVFNAGTTHDYELGRKDCRGTITCRQKHTFTTHPSGTAAVLSLKSRAAAPYVTLIGSALLHRIPFVRTRGDEVDNVEFAVVLTGSDWAFSDVPA